jgi:hypothetical protein
MGFVTLAVAARRFTAKSRLRRKILKELHRRQAIRDRSLTAKKSKASFCTKITNFTL